MVEPDVGRLASQGEHGVGRLAEPAHFSPPLRRSRRAARTAANGAQPRRRDALAGLHVLVTAGGTREPIDSVRFIANSSSGRMGFALAQAAQAAARR